MKSIIDIINEKLKITKTKQKEIIIAKDKDDLRKIILNEMDIQGVNLDLRHIDVSNITNMEYLFDTYSKFNKIESLDITNWNVSNVKSAESMFENMYELKEIYGFGDLKFKTTERLDSCFSGCHKLEYIENIENFKLYPSCTRISFMFALCDKLNELDLNNWDVSNVEWFSGIFMDNKLTKLYIDKWNVSNGYSFSSMFYGCSNLISIDLSKWDISSGRIFDKMFAYCSELISIGNVTNWNLKRCSDYSYLFYYCKKLTLDVTSWIFNDKAKKLSMYTYTNKKKFIRGN